VCAVAGVATVNLIFTPPSDDGGMPVLGYVVARQERWEGEYLHEAVMQASPSPSPGKRTIVVTGLVPNSKYR
jgi:hypothetical protein